MAIKIALGPVENAVHVTIRLRRRYKSDPADCKGDRTPFEVLNH